MKKNQIWSLLIWTLSLVFLSGCDNGKTSESVLSQNTLEACTTTAVANRYVVQWEDGTFTIEHAKSVEDFKINFIQKKLALIKHIDQDHRIQLKTNLSPSYSSPTTLAVAGLNWGSTQIEAPAVWSQGFRGDNVLVGVVDGMIDATHVQLAPNIFSIQQFNNELNDPSQNQHGSHVSGIIAADPNHGPVTGVAPKSKIIGGQFIANDGGGSLGEAILAMNSVAARGAKIINMSWGGAPCVENLKSAFEQLSNRGIILVTAAGNDGTNLDFSPSYPAAFAAAHQINVAATTIDDFMVFFSNRGYRTVHIGAPGVKIFSTIPHNQIESLDGTSMAAPFISGVAALLLSARPQATAQQVKLALLNSVDTSASVLQVSSRGRVNARRALDELKKMLP